MRRARAGALIFVMDTVLIAGFPTASQVQNRRKLGPLTKLPIEKGTITRHERELEWLGTAHSLNI